MAISQWQGQFNELDGGDINFTVSSSVIGMNEFCANTVSFGATDIAYSTQQSNCTTDQVPYPFQYMPDVAGGLAFEYNLTGQNGQPVTNLILNATVLEGIFTGGITKLERLRHPGAESRRAAAERGHHPVLPQDPSGENYLLSDYFLHTDPGPITAFQKLATIPTTVGQPSATWASFQNGVPPGLGGLVPASGSDAASQGPAHTAGRHLLRRDRLRQERGASGGIGGEPGRLRGAAHVVQRGDCTHLGHPVLGPHPEPRERLHQPQP